MFNLTVPDNFTNINGRLCIKLGDNYIAEEKMIDFNGVYLLKFIAVVLRCISIL